MVLHAKGPDQALHQKARLDVTVLHGVDLQIRAGETLAIVGASGSGKSTLLHLLGGLDSPRRARCGSGASCPRWPERQGQLRNQHLGFIYQFHHLLPGFQRARQRGHALRIRRLPWRANWGRTRVLAKVGLAGRVQHRPAELSGGERQRVMPLARAWSRARPVCWPTSPPATSPAPPINTVFFDDAVGPRPGHRRL